MNEKDEEEISFTNILVMGSGNFGTCLSYHLASGKLKNNITIYSRNEDVVKSINEQHKNPIYLKNYTLPEKIRATTELNEKLLNSTNVILFAIPTQHMRTVLKKMSNLITKDHLLIFANKGIENKTLLLPC